MRILLTNDDGINAPGLAVLEALARTLSDDIWIVAPETDQSGVGHAMSLSEAMRMRKVREQAFALTGTPTDCVIMAVRQVLPEPPDLILSGVNSGPNVGDHVLYSGTVAGAMEGAFLGIRSIAISQSFPFDGTRITPWNTVETLGPDVLRKAVRADLPNDVFLNINFPHCPPEACEGIEIVSQGKFEHGLFIEKRRDGRGIPYYWLTFGDKPPELVDGTDIKAIRENRIAISPLKLDLTHEHYLRHLRNQFA